MPPGEGNVTSYLFRARRRGRNSKLVHQHVGIRHCVLCLRPLRVRGAGFSHFAAHFGHLIIRFAGLPLLAHHAASRTEDLSGAEHASEVHGEDCPLYL